MSEREYAVVLQRGVDYSQFHQDMISSYGNDIVPQRTVDVANARPGSKRITHYALTDQEAEILKNDPRVYAVEIPPEQRTDIQIGLRATQSGDFTKTTSDSGNFLNWGMRRVNEAANPYTGNTATGNYNYTLDGTGVDIVIQDSGIQVDHPEFNDANGVSRVQQIDWYAESGLSGTQSVDHYRDLDGHGTHVAGTAAGLTYGWAKNARIYSQKLRGLEGVQGDTSGIPASAAFDTIRLWHANKPVDPATGYKRPTVVNMSWGYSGFYQFNSINGHSITYRGVTYTGTDVDTAIKRHSYGLPTNSEIDTFNGEPYYAYNTRVAADDAEIQEMIDEGIIVCIAAGNNFHKIDIVGGTDYNNFASCNVYNFNTGVFNPGSFFIHRGSSPYDDEAMIVGNIDSVENVSNIEQKASSSECGPGVNIYAPGTNIMSCTSTTNKFADGVYPLNSSYRICNISGTSMASPQVAGLAALFLELNPGATPAQVRNWLINNAQTGTLLTTGNDNDYTNLRSLMGGNDRFLYNPFNSANQINIIQS